MQYTTHFTHQIKSIAVASNTILYNGVEALEKTVAVVHLN